MLLPMSSLLVYGCVWMHKVTNIGNVHSNFIISIRQHATMKRIVNILTPYTQ